MRRPATIRRSLLTNLVAVILLLGGAILLTVFTSARRTVVALTSRTIDRAMAQVEARLDGFFRPIDDTRAALAGWIGAGTLDATDGTVLAQLVEPAFARHPHLRSVSIGDAAGGVLVHERTADGFRQRQWINAGPPRERTWPGGDAPPPWARGADAPEDDPRTTDAWLDIHTTAPGAAVWSDPRPRAEDALPALHMGSTAVDASGRHAQIMLDVDLAQLNAFLDERTVSPGGSAFVLTEDGRLLGLPSRFLPRTDAPPETDPGGLLRHPADLGITVLHDAATAFAALPVDDRVGVPFQFTSEGTVWWASLDAYPLTADRRIFIAGLVPRDDILPDLTDARLAIVLIVAVVLAGAIVRAQFLARSFSRPVEALVEDAQRISRGDLDDRPPVRSHVVEVRRLSVAIQRMRGGLRSLMKLEDDLRVARAIQQRTFPDAAPPLPGFDVAGHSNPADATGGDSYDFVPFPGASGAGELLVLLADATGHGVGPALSVSQVRAMVRMGARLHPDVKVLLDHLNRQLCADLPAGHFVTAWLGRLVPATRELHWFSAGQAPLFHYVAATGAVDRYDANAFPLGIEPELA